MHLPYRPTESRVPYDGFSARPEACAFFAQGSIGYDTRMVAFDTSIRYESSIHGYFGWCPHLDVEVSAESWSECESALRVAMQRALRNANQLGILGTVLAVAARDPMDDLRYVQWTTTTVALGSAWA